VPTNPLQAVARRPASYRLMLKQSAMVERTERAMRRLTQGRLGVLDLVGLPSVVVTAPGRKTGIPRVTTLQYLPDGDAMLLVGSNWGRQAHPAWSANLMAAERISVRRRNERFDASVRSLTGDERDRVWERIIEFWPNYQIAQQLAAVREFRLFSLERI
jgi:deazaflavin-dependent oxidoreductase (nitroreductase family)